MPDRSSWRSCGTRRGAPHVFSPPWWAAFLRQYVHVIQDCPMLLETPVNGGLRKATVAGHEILDGGAYGPQVESVFEIRWDFEFEDGGHFPMAQGLAIEKDIPNLFGRAGRIAQGAGKRDVSPPAQR